MGAPSLVLAANAVPLRGGQGLNLHHVHEALAAAFDVSVWCRGGEGVAYAVPPSRLARALLRVPVLRRRKDWLALADDRQFDAAVARRLGAAHPRVFQGVAGQCALALDRARAQGAVTVLDALTTHVDDFAERSARECAPFGVMTPVGSGMRARTHREYASADVVRVMSARAARTFLERGFDARRLVVATPPMDVSAFPQATFRQPTFRVGFVGLIEPWKGFHHLLDAFGRLAVADAELVFWGGAGSRGATRLLQEVQARDPRVRVRPEEIRRAGLETVFGGMSVLAHPSVADGFGYSVAEAMAAGVPVIVTDNTGAADLVQDGVNGYVIPVGDVDALHARLEHLARNPQLLPAMGAAARAAVARLTPEAFRASLVERIQREL